MTAGWRRARFEEAVATTWRGVRDLYGAAALDHPPRKARRGQAIRRNDSGERSLARLETELRDTA